MVSMVTIQTDAAMTVPSQPEAMVLLIQLLVKAMMKAPRCYLLLTLPTVPSQPAVMVLSTRTLVKNVTRVMLIMVVIVLEASRIDCTICTCGADLYHLRWCHDVSRHNQLSNVWQR